MKKIFFTLVVLSIIMVNAGAQQIVHVSHGEIGEPENLLPYFEDASKEFNVPTEILMGIGYVESHWRQRIPDEHDDHMPAAYGVMGLRNDPHFGYSLKKAAGIIHLPVSQLKQNSKNNIRGAAAYLSYLADKENLANNVRADFMKWETVVEKYSGIPQTNVARLYAHDVYAILLKGANSGHIQISRRDINQAWLDALELRSDNNYQRSTDAAEYSGALWSAANTSNYTAASRPSTYAINKIIMHDMEGSYAGSISWFKNSASSASAHYCIRSSDGQITQMVLEKDAAWHCGNWNYNSTSIGIELEGYYNDPSYYTTAQYNASAALCSYICSKYSIAKTHEYILGHNQVPNPNNGANWGGVNGHSDPGGFYDWQYLIKQTSGVTPTYMPVKVNASYLNIRVEPTANSPVITTIAQNQEFVQYGTASNGWALIFIPGGNSRHFDGWCSNTNLVTDACAPQVEVIDVWPGTLNIRSSSVNSTSVLDKAANGQRFVATGSPVSGFDGNTSWRNFYVSASATAASGWATGAKLNYTGGGSTIATVSISAPAATVCSNQDLIITPTPVHGGTNPVYNWFKGGTAAGTGATYTLSSPSANTDIYCSMTSNESCVAVGAVESNHLNITVNTAPATPVITPPNPGGCSSVELTASSNGCNNCTYQWNTPGGTINGTSVTATASGSYTIISSNSVCSASASVNFVNGGGSGMNVSINPASTSIPLGEVVTLTTSISGGTGPYRYKWSPAGTLSSDTAANPIASPLESTTYSLSVTDANNCISIKQAEVTVAGCDASVRPVIITSGNNLSAPLYQDATYKWQINGQDIPGATTRFMTVESAGYYTAIITISGCSYSTNDFFFTGVEDILLHNFSVTPNPSNGNFKLSFETIKAENISIRIYDVTGRLIKEETPGKILGTYTAEINLGNPARGIYTLQLKSDNKTLNRKIEIN